MSLSLNSNLGLFLCYSVALFFGVMNQEGNRLMNDSCREIGPHKVFCSSNLAMVLIEASLMRWFLTPNCTLESLRGLLKYANPQGLSMR